MGFRVGCDVGVVAAEESIAIMVVEGYATAAEEEPI
jgi:hypothetical protein